KGRPGDFWGVGTLADSHLLSRILVASAAPPSLTRIACNGHGASGVVSWLSFKGSSMRRIAGVKLDQPFFSVYPSSIRTLFRRSFGARCTLGSLIRVALLSANRIR